MLFLRGVGRDAGSALSRDLTFHERCKAFRFKDRASSFMLGGSHQDMVVGWRERNLSLSRIWCEVENCVS